MGATTEGAHEGAQATAEEKYAGEGEANQNTQHSEQSHFAAGSARSPSAPEEHGHNGNASRSKKHQRSLHQLRHEAQFSIAHALSPGGQDAERAWRISAALAALVDTAEPTSNCCSSFHTSLSSRPRLFVRLRCRDKRICWHRRRFPCDYV